MMDLNQLRIFVAVANAGGFAAAADALDVTPSTVTRAITRLETSLGVRLFNRTTRSVSLTEAGEIFLAQISPSLNEIDAAAEFARKGRTELTGTLRVSASVSFGQHIIAPALPSFHRDHPNLAVDLMLSDAVSDLVADRIDVAVRHGTLQDSSLVARRLANVTYRLVASPDYLRDTAPIETPSDIARHTCLTYPYAAFRSTWRFQRGGSQQDIDLHAKMRVSNASALAVCAKSGLGLALLADWLVDPDIQDRTLVPVLPDWSVSGGGGDEDPALWIVTPSRLFVPAKTGAFLEFLKRRVGH